MSDMTNRGEFERRAREWFNDHSANQFQRLIDLLREVHNEAVEKCADSLTSMDPLSFPSQCVATLRALRAPTEGSGADPYSDDMGHNGGDSNTWKERGDG